MRLSIFFRVDLNSTPRSPSMDATKGKKCWCFWRQAFRFNFLFALSTSWRNSSGIFDKWGLESLFTTCMSWTPSVTFWKISRIRSSTFCSVASGLFFDGECVDPYGCYFGLCAAWPTKMRSLSRTWVWVEDFPERSATPSCISLWRTVTIPPFFQSMA